MLHIIRIHRRRNNRRPQRRRNKNRPRTQPPPRIRRSRRITLPPRCPQQRLSYLPRASATRPGRPHEPLCEIDPFHRINRYPATNRPSIGKKNVTQKCRPVSFCLSVDTDTTRPHARPITRNLIRPRRHGTSALPDTGRATPLNTFFARARDSPIHNGPCG